MDKGLIKKGQTEYIVDCGNSKCKSNTFVDYFHTKKAFIGSLRKSGWKMVNGIWMCPDCQYLVSIERGEKR
jgi:hypothetical protein